MALLGEEEAMVRLAEIVAERIEHPEDQKVCICHGDCIDEAEYLKTL